MSRDAAGTKTSVNPALAYRFTAIAFAACAVPFGLTQDWTTALPFVLVAFTFFILGQEEKKKRSSKTPSAQDSPED